VLDVLFRGLKASPVAWMCCFFIKKRKKNSSCIFLKFLVIKTLDPDSLEMLDPDLDPNPGFQKWRGRQVSKYFFLYKKKQFARFE